MYADENPYKAPRPYKVPRAETSSQPAGRWGGWTWVLLAVVIAGCLFFLLVAALAIIVFYALTNAY